MIGSVITPVIQAAVVHPIISPLAHSSLETVDSRGILFLLGILGIAAVVILVLLITRELEWTEQKELHQFRGDDDA